MKYNEKYDRWCDEEGNIYKEDKNGVLIECVQTYSTQGYLRVYCNKKMIGSHRVIWETLKGPIPPGYVIDHINTIKDDNRICNLKCCTVKDNVNNPISKKRRTKSLKGRVMSEFGKKFKEHYNLTPKENYNLYQKEREWFKRHGKCRWE